MRPAVQSLVSEHLVYACVRTNVHVCVSQEKGQPVSVYVKISYQCAVLLDPESVCHLEPTGLREKGSGKEDGRIKRKHRQSFFPCFFFFF